MIFLITLFFVSLNTYAQYDCEVFNPSGDNQYRKYNSSSSECDDWFNANKASNGFKCNGECTLTKIDKTSHYQAITEKIQIMNDIKKGENIIAHVVYLNNARGASDAIKIAFLSNNDVKQAKDLLSVGRISLARSVISNASADGEIITAQLKNDILSFIDSL
jgi:hypothetical protein